MKYDLSAVLNFSDGAPFHYNISAAPTAPAPVEMYIDKYNTTEDFQRVRSTVKTDAPIVRFFHRIGKYPRGDHGLMINREILRRAIVPSNGLVARYKSTVRELGMDDGRYISVHARLGGGPEVREQDNERFAPLIEHLQDVAACFALRSLRIALPLNVSIIYLATDTPRFKGIFTETMRIIANANNLTTRVVVAPWEDTGHIERSKKSDSGSDEVVINTFAELLILGNSHYFLHLPSTFADLAKWMGNVTLTGEVKSAENALNCKVKMSRLYSNLNSEGFTE